MEVVVQTAGRSGSLLPSIMGPLASVCSFNRAGSVARCAWVAPPVVLAVARPRRRRLATTAAAPVATRPAPTASALVTGTAAPVNGKVAVGLVTATGCTPAGGFTCGGGGCWKLTPRTPSGVVLGAGVWLSVGVGVGDVEGGEFGGDVAVDVGVGVGDVVGVGGGPFGGGDDPPPPLAVAACADVMPNPDTTGATHTRPAPTAAPARKTCLRLIPFADSIEPSPPPASAPAAVLTLPCIDPPIVRPHPCLSRHRSGTCLQSSCHCPQPQ